MATTVGFVLSDEVLQADLRGELTQVEDLLRESVRGEDDFVNDAALHLIDAGGKRFRPLVALLAAHFGDPTAAGVLEAAVVVELTHLATLYHDDVMDEASRRRGAASANARWDNSVAILTGDYLFARASDVVSGLGPEAVRIQAQTFQRLVIGQIHETVGPADGQDRIAHYFSVLADKTGSLIGTAARFGAMFGRCDRATVGALGEFGEKIGVAFQLADDLVDIGSDGAKSGKTQGTDLREGVLTLPGMLVLAADEPGDARLRRLLAGPLPDARDHAEALELLRSHRAVVEARRIAARWADEARAALAPLAPGGPRAALEQLCEYVVARGA